MSQPTVILYGYEASPFWRKIQNVLTLKRIPHKRVKVAMVLPRPEITDLLGIKYRRIPILAIGNDIYCDTSLIASALERRFPPSEGYGTIYPPRLGSTKADTGLAKALTVYWNDKVVFSLGGQSLPYDKLGKKFIEDRANWQGSAIDTKKLAATQGLRTSAISSHVQLLEEQLSDGRQWLLDTDEPGLVDIDVHFLYQWLPELKALKEVFDPKVFPKTLSWIERTTKWLEQAQRSNAASHVKISGEDSAKAIVSSSHEDYGVVGFDSSEARRLNLSQGDLVRVTPLDNARIPTHGRIVALNREEVVIEVQGTAGAVRAHFPRLEFSVKSGSSAEAKL